MGWVSCSKVVHMCILSAVRSCGVCDPGIKDYLYPKYITCLIHIVTNTCILFICMLLWLMKEILKLSYLEKILKLNYLTLKINFLESLGSHFPSSFFFFPFHPWILVPCGDLIILSLLKRQKQDSKAPNIKDLYCVLCCETFQIGPLFKDGPQPRCLKFHHQRASYCFLVTFWGQSDLRDCKFSLESQDTCIITQV